MEQWYKILWTDETWITGGRHTRTWVTGEQERSRNRPVLWNDTKGRRVGCSGVVFIAIQRDQVYSGKMTGDLLIRTHIRHIQSLLSMVILS